MHERSLFHTPHATRPRREKFRPLTAKGPIEPSAQSRRTVCLPGLISYQLLAATQIGSSTPPPVVIAVQDSGLENGMGAVESRTKSPFAAVRQNATVPLFVCWRMQR